MLAGTLRVGHLADVHLGASISGFEELEADVEEAFRDAIQALLDASVDAIIIAGDLFDRPRPPNRAVRAAIEAFREAARRGVRVLATLGEHDYPRHRDISPVHLAAESAGGVAVPPTRIPAGSTPLDVVSSSTFEVGGGHVVLLPFVKAPIERRRSATRILLEAASRLAARLGGPRVLAAHLGLEGYTFPDDAVASPQSLAGFDYAALGHIHKRIISTGDSSPAPWAYPAPLVPLNAQEARLSVEEPWPRGPLVVEVSRGEARVEEVEIEQPRLQAYLAASRPTRDSLLRAAREALARAGARARVRGGSKPLLHLSLTLGGGPSELSPREAVRLLERSLGVRVRVSSVRRFRQPAIVAASPAGGVGGEVEVIARLLAGGRRGVAAPEALARLAEGILALKREAARDDADPQAVQSMLEELVSSGEYEPAWRAVEGAARSWWG